MDSDDAAEPLSSAGPGSPAPVTLSRGKLRRAGIVAAVAAALVAGIGIADRAFSERAVARWTADQATPEVSVVKPQRADSAEPLVLPGNVRAWVEAPIYARVNGYLKKWYFDYGAHVRQGQVLADIDTPEVDAQFAAAQADLDAARAKVQVAKASADFAKSTYDRWRDSPKGVVSVQETESKKADYETALASYEAAVAGVKSDEGLVNRLGALEQFKHIRAPFDGVVTERNTDIGDLINAGSGGGGDRAPQLFRVADMHRMRVFVDVPQAMSAQITLGMMAELNLPQYPDRTFRATVATTARAISASSRTLLVELYADNPDGMLTPGTYAEVHFALATNPHVLTIPTTALVFRRSGLQVAVLDASGRVKLRSIQVGRNLGDTVEILTGLSPSDRVIDSPPDSVENGDLVRVADPGVLAAPSEVAGIAGIAGDSPGGAVRAHSYARGASTVGGQRSAH